MAANAMAVNAAAGAGAGGAAAAAPGILAAALGAPAPVPIPPPFGSDGLRENARRRQLGVAAVANVGAGGGGAAPPPRNSFLTNFNWLCSRAGIATTTVLSWASKPPGRSSIDELLMQYESATPRFNSTSLMYQNRIKSAAENLRLSKEKALRFPKLLVKLFYYQKNQNQSKKIADEFLCQFLDELLYMLNTMKKQVEQKAITEGTLAARGVVPQRAKSGLADQTWDIILGDPALASVIWAVLDTNAAEFLGIEGDKYPIQNGRVEAGNLTAFATLIEGTTDEERAAIAAQIERKLSTAIARDADLIITEEDIARDAICKKQQAGETLFGSMSSAGAGGSGGAGGGGGGGGGGPDPIRLRNLPFGAGIRDPPSPPAHALFVPGRRAASAAPPASASASASAASALGRNGGTTLSGHKRSRNNATGVGSSAGAGRPEPLNVGGPFRRPRLHPDLLLPPGPGQYGGYRKRTRKSNRKVHRKVHRKHSRKAHRKSNRKTRRR